MVGRLVRIVDASDMGSLTTKSSGVDPFRITGDAGAQRGGDMDLEHSVDPSQCLSAVTAIRGYRSDHRPEASVQALHCQRGYAPALFCSVLAAESKIAMWARA